MNDNESNNRPRWGKTKPHTISLTREEEAIIEELMRQTRIGSASELIRQAIRHFPAQSLALIERNRVKALQNMDDLFDDLAELDDAAAEISGHKAALNAQKEAYIKKWALSYQKRIKTNPHARPNEADLKQYLTVVSIPARSEPPQVVGMSMDEAVIEIFDEYCKLESHTPAATKIRPIKGVQP